MKAEVHKIDINKLVKVLTRLTSLKTKLDHLNVDKLKTVSVDLRKKTDLKNQHTTYKSK